jgi:hypothetical protein
LNPFEKATSASPLNPTFALVGVRIFPQFSIFFGQHHQIPAQSEVRGGENGKLHLTLVSLGELTKRGCFEFFFG